MPFVCRADKVPYTRSLCWISSRTDDDWSSTGRYKLVSWAKPYNRFCLVKGVEDWSRELDFGRRQRANRKECRYISWHDLEVFALPGRGRSEFYKAVLKSLLHNKAHCGLRLPNPVVYSYPTNLYCNESAASLSVGCITKAKYVVFSHDAFLRAVHYGRASCFALDEMRSGCGGRGALLRVPRMLVDQ